MDKYKLISKIEKLIEQAKQFKKDIIIYNYGSQYYFLEKDGSIHSYSNGIHLSEVTNIEIYLRCKQEHELEEIQANLEKAIEESRVEQYQS